MSSQHQPYIPLDSIILDYINETEQSATNKYAKLFHLAFRCMDTLGLDFFYRVKSVKLPVNPNFTVTLPADYINYTKIGILNATGSIIPLINNPNFTTYADLLPDRVTKTQDLQSALLEWGGACNTNQWMNFWDGYGYTNVFGVPSGEPFVGSFKVDTENGVILLNDRFDRTYIMLEYVACPTQGQEYYVPVQFREAIIAFLHWKDAKVGAGRYAWRIEGNLKHEYYNERRLAIARWKPIRAQEAYQASQEQSRLSIKT